MIISYSKFRFYLLRGYVIHRERFDISTHYMMFNGKLTLCGCGESEYTTKELYEEYLKAPSEFEFILDSCVCTKKKVYITKNKSFTIRTPHECPFRDSHAIDEACLIADDCYEEDWFCESCPLEDAE